MLAPNATMKVQLPIYNWSPEIGRSNIFWPRAATAQPRLLLRQLRRDPRGASASSPAAGAQGHVKGLL
jgi:hypothetical protein